MSISFGRARRRGVVVGLTEDAPPGVDAVPVERVLGAVPACARRPRALAGLLLRIDSRARPRPRGAAGARAGAPRAKARATGVASRGGGRAARPDWGSGGCRRADRGRHRVRRRAFSSTARRAAGRPRCTCRACAAALERDRTAIVLVPEIALTPQALARFRARFGDVVACLHSEPERSRATRRARADRCRRGPDRRRSPVGDLRAGRAAGRGLRRRGARSVVQARVRPALRRSHRRRAAGGARGRGRDLRQRHAPAGELGAPRAASSSAGGSPARYRPCASSICAASSGYPLSAPLLAGLGRIADAAARRSCS